MAINPNMSFPTQTMPSSAAFPYGAAQNITVPGDNTGTPWTKLVIDDIWGFQQALLNEAGIVPNGAADTVLLSQYLQAILSLISSGGTPNATRYTISTNNNSVVTYDSTNHMNYQRLTNVAAIAVTMQAPVAPFGDSITIEKVAGAGNITIAGAPGISVLTISGGTLDLTTDGQVGSLISINATTWKFIK